MRTIRHCILIIAVVVMSLSIARADTITLKNGNVVDGKVLSEEKDAKGTIVLETFNGNITVKKGDIHQRSRGKGKYENYLEKIGKLKEDDSEGHYNVAIWCKGQKLWKLAKHHLAEALKIKPDGQKAKKELENVENAVKSEVRQSQVPMEIVVGVKQSLSKAEVEKLTVQVIKMAEQLARATGGSMYVEKATFNVGQASGDLVYDKEFTGTPNGVSNIPMGVKNWWAGVILHEWAHAKLGLGDEYDTSVFGGPKAGACPDCIMALKYNKGFCNASNHKESKNNNPGCQEVLSQKYPQLGKGFSRSPEEVEEMVKFVPETKIVINGAK